MRETAAPLVIPCSSSVPMGHGVFTSPGDVMEMWIVLMAAMKKIAVGLLNHLCVFM